MSRADAAPLQDLRWPVTVIAAVAAIWLLRAAAVVVIPLATAFFIAIAIYPVQVHLHARFPRRRWLALALTMALLLAVTAGAMWAVAESVDEAVEAAPRYAGRVQELWGSVKQTMSAYGVPLPDNVLASPDVQQRLGTLTASAVRLASEIVTGLVLVFFLVLLMLLEAPVWDENTRRVLQDDRGRLALDTIGEIAEKVRGYLYVRTLLGLMSAGAAGLWLLILDVDLVLVWVVLTFALNYIPNLGSVLAVIPPSLMAAVQHGPMHALITIGGLTVFEQIIGNFIDPRMQGRRLQISPVVVLVALIFWTWMWGAVGALLAVPMTVTLLAAAAHVPGLERLAALVAAERDHSGPSPPGAGRRAA